MSLTINNSYGRIYCLQVDRVAMLLHSYRLYRDAVIQQVGFSQILNALLFQFTHNSCLHNNLEIFSNQVESSNKVVVPTWIRFKY